MDEQNRWEGFDAGDPDENIGYDEAKKRINRLFTEDYLKHLFVRNRRQSEDILRSNSKLDRFIADAEKKLKKFPVAGSILSNIPTMIDMLRCYFKKEYTHLSPMTLIAVITALAYWILPLDVIPDTIPLVGLLDDAMVIQWALRQISGELQDFKIWRASRDEVNG